MMAENKGDDLMSQAERKLQRGCRKSDNFEDAAELYESAATQYKISKNWDKAGDAYLQAAEMMKLAKNDSEAASFYSSAAQAYKKVDSKEALRVYNLAASMHMERNRFSTAARMYKEIAELCEEVRDSQGAIEAYSKAADCFEAEDSKASKTQMLLKIAHYAAVQEDYKRAVETWEEVASSSLNNTMIAWRAKDCYFNAMFCHMLEAAQSQKFDGAENALETYKSNYPAIEGTRECKMVEQCLCAMRDGEVEAFEQTIVDLDSIIKLDDWKIEMLLKIKNIMITPPVVDPLQLLI
jgi:alpha-soluble NSF attachment protein